MNVNRAVLIYREGDTFRVTYGEPDEIADIAEDSDVISHIPLELHEHSIKALDLACALEEENGYCGLLTLLHKVIDSVRHAHDEFPVTDVREGGTE